MHTIPKERSRNGYSVLNFQLSVRFVSSTQLEKKFVTNVDALFVTVLSFVPELANRGSIKSASSFVRIKKTSGEFFIFTFKRKE